MTLQIKSRDHTSRNVRFNIGIVDVLETQGGRRAFIDSFLKALCREGHTVKIIRLDTVSVGELNSFDILHFSTHYLSLNLWKLLFARHPKKILTVHGWIQSEVLWAMRNQSNLRTKIAGLLSLLTMKLMPLFFDLTTCPSRRTADENNLRNAVIISNAIFPEYFENISEIKTPRNQNEVWFVTYASAGGSSDILKMTILNIKEVVEKLNELLKNRKVKLMIFGKDYLGTDRSSCIFFMGYSSKFLNFLKSSDLFIVAGPFFPGYAEMEAGILGLPVAKFTDDYAVEEIVDGQTGILAKDKAELVNKLLNYILNLKREKQRLGSNFRRYIENNRSWDSVIPLWNRLFVDVLAGKHEQILKHE